MVCFIFSFFVGHTLFSVTSIPCKTKENVSALFYKTTIGFILQILIYSIFKTNLLTINSLILILFIYIFFRSFKKNNLFDFKIFKSRTCIYAIIPVSIIFFWKYYCLFNENKAFPIVINSDSIYHSNLSIFLQKFGVENLNTNHFDLPDGTYPYHYFEAWTTAYFSEILNLNHWITEELIVYPIFSSLTVLGLYSILEKFKFLNILTSVGSIFVLNFSGIYTIISNFDFFLLQYKETYAFSYNALDEFWCLKLVVIYLMITIVINLYVDKKYYLATVVLMATSFFSITIFLGFAFGILFFLLFSWLFRKQINLFNSNELRNLIIINLLIIISLFIFYKTTESNYNFIIKPNLNQIILSIDNFTKIKSKMMYFLIRLTQLLLIYLPFILILVFLLKKFYTSLNFKLVYLFFGLVTSITITSLTIWNLLDFSFGSKGYFFYSILPIYNVLSVIIILLAIKYLKNKPLKNLLFFGFLCIGIFNSQKTIKTYNENKNTLWNSFSQKFLKEVYNDSKYIKSNYGGRIEGVNFFKNSITNDNIDYLGFFMSGFYKNSYNYKITTSISAGYTNLNSPEILTQTKKYIKAMPIYNFYKVEKRKNINDFIKKHNISYLLVNKNETIFKEIKFKKKIFDNKSGITYYRLF